MKLNKGNVIKYAVTLAIGGAAAFGIMCYRGLLESGLTHAERLMYVCDGLFVAGLLLAGFGALAWIASTGFFDIFSYAFKSLIYLFTPIRSRGERQKYYEYHGEMDDKRAKEKGKTVYYILVCGLVFLAAAVIVFVFYNAAA